MADTNISDVSAETHWEKAAKTRMGKYLTQIETHFIKESIDLSANIIVDVGAEAGRFSDLTKTDRSETISLDIDSYGLKRLKLKTQNTSVIQADARKIPLRNEIADAIFMIEVLDYIPESDQAFAECWRALKSNASLVVSFGNKSSLKSKIRELKGKSYRHSYKEVIKNLMQSGFIVKRKTGYNWLLFGRTSQNRFIPVLAGMERAIGLRRIPSFSPWVIIHAVKSS